MPSFLLRYQTGDHEGVWRDLVALGERVHDRPVRDDAREVAHETMMRARRNLELLVPRLRDLGFRFAFPDRVRVAPDTRTTAILDRLDAAAGPLPLSLRAFHEVVGPVCLMGSHPALCAYAEPPSLEELADEVQRALALPRAVGRTPSDGPSSTRLAEARRLAGAIAVQRPSLAGPVSDPLVVSPLPFDEPDDYLLFDDDADDHADDESAVPARRRWAIDVAPDALQKAGQGGGGPSRVLLPDPRADAPLVGARHGTFVAHLRESLRWGGFPGLAGAPPVAEPSRELSRLTSGMLPL